MGKDHIAPATEVTDHEEPKLKKVRLHTLGNIRLRHHETNEIILIPTPSRDPNDPLNWPSWKKHTIAVLICMAMLMCNFLAAGPTVAIVQTTLEFYPDPTALAGNISKIAYFFTTTALMQGLGNFIWVPLANKFGRRPVYVVSYAIYLACSIWLIFEHSFNGFLAGRIIMGLGAGAAETIAPITIADIFFLHERGTIMALYTSFLSVGVAFGMLICGLITIHNDWRVIYEVASALIGLILVLAFFCFPETAFNREAEVLGHSDNSVPASPITKVNTMGSKSDAVADAEHASTRAITPRKKSYIQELKIYNGILTHESLFKIFLRPLGLIFLPPVLWAALVESVTIGFVVAVTSNVASAFNTTYGFESWQVGLCFISAIVGSVFGIPAGGQLGDFVADYFTKRNGGLREPEMRLPAMIPCLIATPLALVLYGVGIEYKLHWICPTIGLGLLNFSIVQGTNICLVYVIDAYRPVAGEITLAVMGFKSLFGFLLSFYTNPWVESAGYLNAYGTMAGIAAIVILGWVPLYIWGKQIRHTTWNWSIVSYIHWDEDREVGE